MKAKSPARVRSRSARQSWQQEIALERIGILFKLAALEFAKRPDRSDRYVGLARKIGMRYNVKIPKELKRRMCNYCYRYIFPGKNSVVRTASREQAVVVKCLNCGKSSRYPYAREKRK